MVRCFYLNLTIVNNNNILALVIRNKFTKFVKVIKFKVYINY